MSAAPRILALVTDAYGGRGGIAQYNRDFLGALASNGAGAQITVLPRHAPDPAAPPPGVVQAPARAGRLAYALGALGAVLGARFDTVFCGHLYMAPLAVLVARLAGARLILQMHGVEAWPRPTPLRRAAAEAADLILCVSRHTRAKVLDWAAIAPERVLVLPNTVGEAFSPGDGAAFRAAWGLEGKRVLLTVGRMDARERYKGHDRVIAALPELIAAGQDVVYLVAGEGDDTPRLQALAAQAGVAVRVRFLGPLGRDALLDAYRAADLFVMPSTGEGFGIAFLEAMACGCPTLGLDVAGAADPLGDGDLGVLTSDAQFSGAVRQALSEPARTPAIVAAAMKARFGRSAFQDAAALAWKHLQPGQENLGSWANATPWRSFAEPRAVSAAEDLS